MGSSLAKHKPYLQRYGYVMLGEGSAPKHRSCFKEMPRLGQQPAHRSEKRIKNGLNSNIMTVQRNRKKDIKEAIDGFILDLKQRGLITLQEAEYLLRREERKKSPEIRATQPSLS